MRAWCAGKDSATYGALYADLQRQLHPPLTAEQRAQVNREAKALVASEVASAVVQWQVLSVIEAIICVGLLVCLWLLYYNGFARDTQRRAQLEQRLLSHACVATIADMSMGHAGVTLDVWPARIGVRISAIATGDLFYGHGLRAGDVLLKFNGAELNAASPRAVIRLLATKVRSPAITHTDRARS